MNIQTIDGRQNLAKFAISFLALAIVGGIAYIRYSQRQCFPRIQGSLEKSERAFNNVVRATGTDESRLETRIKPFEASYSVPTKFITVQQLQEREVECYHEIHKRQEITPVPLPFQCTHAYKDHFFAPTFVLCLKRGRVFGLKGVVVTSQNEVIAETAREWKPIWEHSIFKVDCLPKPEKIEGRIAVIASNGPTCYYHWMFDILPRLFLLQSSKISYDKIYVPDIWYPFQKDTLKYFGLDESKIIYGNKNTYIDADELIVPSLPAEPYMIPKWACHFLRETFLPRNPVPSDGAIEKLYVSRGKAAARKVVNEEEVFASLEAEGFIRVFLEDLPFEKQVLLFSQAKCIVAPHGAGLSNLVFCNPGTKVIEFFPENYLDTTYAFLSHQMELTYKAVVTSLKDLDREEQAAQNMLISMERMQLLLNESWT